MTAALTRTAIIQSAIERGIADYIINNLVVAVPDEQIYNAKAMRQALADMVTGSTGRGHLADRIERVGAALVASLREQPQGPPEEPVIVDGGA